MRVMTQWKRFADDEALWKELSETKTKVKTRREPGTESIPEKKGRRNLFDKLRGKDRDVPKEDAKQENSADVFGRLKRRTVSYARKLIGASVQDKKGSLKWEQFLQVRRVTLLLRRKDL